MYGWYVTKLCRPSRSKQGREIGVVDNHKTQKEVSIPTDIGIIEIKIKIARSSRSHFLEDRSDQSNDNKLFFSSFKQ